MHKLGTLGVPAEYVINALQLGAIWHLAKLAPTRQAGPLVLTAAVCPHCADGNIDLVLEDRTEDDRGRKRMQELLRLTYPRAALAVLEDVFPWEKRERQR
jgi:hypothetical protein